MFIIIQQINLGWSQELLEAHKSFQDSAAELAQSCLPYSSTKTNLKATQSPKVGK